MVQTLNKSIGLDDGNNISLFMTLVEEEADILVEQFDKEGKPHSKTLVRLNIRDLAQVGMMIDEARNAIMTHKIDKESTDGVNAFEPTPQSWADCSR